MRTASADPGGAAPPGERVQKLLARAGVASRRAAEALIAAGRVLVDGVPATLGQRVPPGAEVRVDGRVVVLPERERTFALHKPRGVVTTASDEHGRRTVLDLVPRVPGLHPVGRLDRDSEGLLILTTDGELTLRLTHPRYGQRKTYRVWCREGTVPGPALARLRRGVELHDGPARALAARAAPGGAVVVLQEGRKRQLRRMLAAVGLEVTRLLRTRVGDLPLGSLAPGAYLELGPRDVLRLGYTPMRGTARRQRASRPRQS
jgi:23S rRNA pseudouridine2605 synthase